MSDPKQKSKRKRRWLSYNLFSLLVVVTIICVALAYWVHRANRQKAVVKWVEENGGRVWYDFELDENLAYIDDAKPSYPEWVRALLGNDYLSTVVTVDLRGSELKDLAPLANLEQLEVLNLDYTQVSDLTPLAGLTSLETLFLDNTQVSDLKPLAGLTSLETLFLFNTQQVSDLKPLAGLTSLKTLLLANTHVSDLTPLMKLTSLRSLWLDNTQVTQEQINELQNALPNCKISWSPAVNATEGN